MGEEGAEWAEYMMGTMYANLDKTASESLPYVIRYDAGSESDEGVGYRGSEDGTEILGGDADLDSGLEAWAGTDGSNVPTADVIAVLTEEVDPDRDRPHQDTV